MYKSAHVMLLDWVGNSTAHGPEGMSRVEGRIGGGGECIVELRAIEGWVHLMPLEPERNRFANKPVDYHIWHEMNDV